MLLYCGVTTTDESLACVCEKDETEKIFQIEKNNMKILVVNSAPKNHQQEIDKVLSEYSFKDSPWRIVSISTSAVVLAEKTFHSETAVGVTTTIALNDTTFNKKGGE